MAHEVKANLSDLASLAAALKDLQWYTSAGGYVLAKVSTAVDGTATWSLEVRPAAPSNPKLKEASLPTRRTVEAGDKVIVETKAQQMTRRIQGGGPEGVEGVVFRVLTRGPHPHGMKVELRDRTVGRVKRNLTAPGAGEPSH